MPELEALDRYLEVASIVAINALVPLILALIAVWIVVFIVSTVLYFLYVAPKLAEEMRTYYFEGLRRLHDLLMARERRLHTAAQERYATELRRALLVVTRSIGVREVPAFLRWLREDMTRRGL